jgi:DNA-binding PadR family transcriptional regulator
MDPHIYIGMNTTSDAESFLPLKPVTFHVLLALGDGPRHGYAIGTAVEALTAGAVRMWPATLYGTIHQLAEQGMLEPVQSEPEPGDDARRRYYRLTPLGTRVLAAETVRLRRLVEAAEQTRAYGRA